MLNFPNNSQVSHNQMPDGFQTAFLLCLYHFSTSQIKSKNPRTIKVREFKAARLLFFNDNLFAVVITTFGTNAMRHFHLMTLRTFD